MAVENPPIFLQAGSHSAEQVRRALSFIMGGRAGVMEPLDLFVSQNGTPNMSVNVATGQVVVLGDEATYQGVYFVENRGTLNLSIGAADPTNDRHDLVVVRVLDSSYSGADDEVSIEVVQGTPAGSPADPALGDGSVFVLARVLVEANATSITNGFITDLRRTYTGQYGQAAARGGIVVCTSTTRPTSPYEGMRIYQTDNDQEYVYNGSNWIVPHALGRLGSSYRTTNQALTTSIVYPNSVTVTTLPNRKLRVRVHANVAVNSGGTTASIGVADGGGTILNQAYRYLAAGGVNDQITCEHETTSGAGGSMTFQISAFLNSGTGNLTAGSTAYAMITVYDEGPA